MTRAQRVRLLAAGLIGFFALSAAAAETVPLPRPAPRPKVLAGDPAPPTNISPPPTAAPRAVTPDPVVTGAVSAPAARLPARPRFRYIATRSDGPLVLDARQRTLVEKVNAYLSGVQTLIGNFVQVGPDGRKSEGQFYLQKPGKVRFEYDPPSPIELIADGQSVAVRDRRLATQQLIPLSQTPLRFLLAERLDLMRDTSVVAVNADDTFISIVIEEKHAIGGTHRLLLMFGTQDYVLRQWTVTDPQGYDTTVALYNLDAKKKPDPALFKINYERVLQ